MNIEVINKERCKNRTYDLIMDSAKTGIPILTPYESDYIWQQAEEMGIDIHEPMTVETYKQYRENGFLHNNGWNGKLLVDELDDVLDLLLNANVVLGTNTIDRYDWRRNMKETNTVKIDKNVVSGVRLNDCPSGKLPTSLFAIPEGGLCAFTTFPVEDNVIPKVTDVNILVPNKVVEVTFLDGTKEKSVCREPDVFSLETAISICISKKIMGGSSAYNNAVKRGMKVYKDKLKKEAAEKSKQESIEAKRKKRLAYKERRDARRVEEAKERQIEIQKEAYLRAMKEFEKNKGITENKTI